MITKVCFKCFVNKPLTEYYRHSKMSDGHLGKCKDCTKKDTKCRANILIEDADWKEKEKERHRIKYHKLGYKDKHKPTSEMKKIQMDNYSEKYPEKIRCSKKFTNLRKKLNVTKDKQLHHWNYNV